MGSTNSGPRLNDDEEAMRRRVYELAKVNGWTDTRAAEHIGLPQSVYKSWRVARKLPRTSPDSKITAAAGKMRELYNTGLPDTEIGRRVELSTQTVRKWRTAAGLKSNVIAWGRPRVDPVEIPDEFKPWTDPESLYCSRKEFLEGIVGHKIRSVGGDK